MEIIEELKILENTYHSESKLLISEGETSVLLLNISNDLVNNTHLKAITRFVAANTSSSYIVNTKESIVIDDNEINNSIDELINNKGITFVINLTPTKETNDIVINASSKIDYTILKELEDAFHEAYITNLNVEKYNNEIMDCDYIEISISNQYHDLDEVENIEKLCNALINFIKMYNNFSD